MNLNCDLIYEWQVVKKIDGSNYTFLEDINLVAKKYWTPAVYRWNICNFSQKSEKIIYIGETQNLFPKRVRGYITPGKSQQTNIRINRIFKEYMEKGYTIILEILAIKEMIINNMIINQENLCQVTIRKMLENLFSILCLNQDFQLLNK